ncbi:hypothetical protein [Undibacterium sp.]|nr:hypothetical protein [Undibacterium sp.]HTD06945.1 hypothetical protein [Undibacterium sp.]
MSLLTSGKSGLVNTKPSWTGRKPFGVVVKNTMIEMAVGTG